MTLAARMVLHAYSEHCPRPPLLHADDYPKAFPEHEVQAHRRLGMFRRSFLSTEMLTSKQQEFVVLLLTLPSRKLERTIPLILSHPPLLAHTIYQSLSFDAALLEEGFKYETTTGASQRGITTWPGLSDVILGKKEWFQVWLEAEQRCTYIRS